MVVFLHLVTEGARLLTTAERARVLTENPTGDRGCRMRLMRLMRIPAHPPKAPAAQPHIAPQTATMLLRELQTAGLVRDVTGRKSLWAFAA